MFYRLGMAAPFADTASEPAASRESFTVLIYGGSTSIALYAAQMVRLSDRFSGKKTTLVGVAGAGKHGVLKAAPYS
jgi:hypothetical protein